jgi:hypothetical protein
MKAVNAAMNRKDAISLGPILMLFIGLPLVGENYTAEYTKKIIKK